MTRYDLIAAAPWIIFGAGLFVVCAQLFRARHTRVRHTGPHRTQERKCPDKNTQSRPR